MNQPSIYITKTDETKLKALLWKAQSSAYRGSEYLKMLEGELNRAQIVEPREIPRDVITLNSTARLVDLETNEEMVYTLVFPEDADVAGGKISILAPIGTAMLGFRVGDSFKWATPDGIQRLQVVEILYQPEASGDYR